MALIPNYFSSGEDEQVINTAKNDRINLSNQQNGRNKNRSASKRQQLCMDIRDEQDSQYQNTKHSGYLHRTVDDADSDQDSKHKQRKSSSRHKKRKHKKKKHHKRSPSSDSSSSDQSSSDSSSESESSSEDSSVDRRKKKKSKDKKKKHKKDKKSKKKDKKSGKSITADKMFTIINDEGIE